MLGFMSGLCSLSLSLSLSPPSLNNMMNDDALIKPNLASMHFRPMKHPPPKLNMYIYTNAKKKNDSNSWSKPHLWGGSSRRKLSPPQAPASPFHSFFSIFAYPPTLPFPLLPFFGASGFGTDFFFFSLKSKTLNIFPKTFLLKIHTYIYIYMYMFFNFLRKWGKEKRIKNLL